MKTCMLYKPCNVEPLSVRVDRNRWRMLGHVLRGPTEGPAIPRAIRKTALVRTVRSGAQQLQVTYIHTSRYFSIAINQKI